MEHDEDEDDYPLSGSWSSDDRRRHKTRENARARGFDVAAAVYKAHGVTIRQIKDKLHDPNLDSEVRGFVYRSKRSCGYCSAGLLGLWKWWFGEFIARDKRSLMDVWGMFGMKCQV